MVRANKKDARKSHVILRAITFSQCRTARVTDKLLIRGVPAEVHSWIENTRRESLLTQREFVLDVLDRARKQRQQLHLFEPGQRLSRSSVGVPFKFVDLFAGIGGLRIGLERVGGTCVFSSEWDVWAQKTYKAWFGEMPRGDIRGIVPGDIPDHDVLAAGFPCQPFSIAGVSKKNSLGRAHGFRDVTQGTLFFYLASIIEEKRPPILLLENVKNLASHDGGRTWEVIRARLDDQLDYQLFTKIIDAAAWVPQHRERLFIVGFDRRVFGALPSFRFPDGPSGDRPRLVDILESSADSKYTLSDHLWSYLQQYAEKHREKGNGFGFSVADPKGISRTLSARYYKDGSEILIPQRGRNPRRLTPVECARLMGFPDHLPIVVSDTQAYRQFGNAVVPPVAEAVAHEIATTLHRHIISRGCLLKAQDDR